ncbi:MAG: hypothetical protein JWM70_430 [Microbacteriaceae bacterium]|nr:hypothetical protein [Microbacteriaceae bacterium]
MPSESEFRDLLRASAAGVSVASSSRLDAASIIRRSRRRRLPQQLAVGGLGTLAIAGIGVGTVSAIQSFLPTSSTMGSAVAPGQSDGEGSGSSSSGGPSTDQGSTRAPADRINLCGGAVADVAPAASGLVLTPDFPASAIADGRPVTGTVTLTNTGTETIRGTTAASPAITVSADGVVLWHSNGPMIMMAAVVDLAPGASMRYQASFTPVRCETADDLAEGFRTDLPALPAGDYRVSAAIDLSREASTPGGSSELVVGPAQTITLR